RECEHGNPFTNRHAPATQTEGPGIQKTLRMAFKLFERGLAIQSRRRPATTKSGNAKWLGCRRLSRCGGGGRPPPASAPRTSERALASRMPSAASYTAERRPFFAQLSVTAQVAL